MGYGKVGFGKDEMCSYKHTHNGAVHNLTYQQQNIDNLIIPKIKAIPKNIVIILPIIPLKFVVHPIGLFQSSKFFISYINQKTPKQKIHNPKKKSIIVG